MDAEITVDKKVKRTLVLVKSPLNRRCILTTLIVGSVFILSHRLCNVYLWSGRWRWRAVTTSLEIWALSTHSPQVETQRNEVCCTIMKAAAGDEAARQRYWFPNRYYERRTNWWFCNSGGIYVLLASGRVYGPLTYYLRLVRYVGPLKWLMAGDSRQWREICWDIRGGIVYPFNEWTKLSSYLYIYGE